MDVAVLSDALDRGQNWRTARHEWRLPTSNRVVAHFDAIQQGLGNKSCGPGPLPKYEIQKGKTYSNIVRFIPFRKRQMIPQTESLP